MKITLYQCPCRKNDVNKINHSTKVVEVEAEVYGDFYFGSASFVLSEKWPSNYCVYRDEKYNLTYCGWTMASTNANGLYTYYITEDILEMAWIDGCFNDTAMVNYSSLGSDYLFDDRAKYLDRVSATSEYMITPKRYPDNANGDYIFVYANVCSYPVYNPGHPQRLAAPDGVATYIFTLKAWYDFTENFETDEEHSKEFGQCILGCGMITADLINKKDIRATNTITLYRYESSGADLWSIDLPQGDVAYEYWGNVPTSAPVSDSYCDPVYYDIPSGGIELYGYRKKGTFTLNIRNGAKIEGNLSQLNVDKITSIGYLPSVSYTGQTVKYILMVNGNPREDITVLASLPNTFPFGYDSTYVSWAQYASQGIGMVAQLATVSAKPASATFGAIQSAAQIAQLVETSEIGGTSMTGSAGGHPDFNSGYTGGAKFVWNEPVDLDNFQAMYGKPDYHMRNLSTLRGYVQTANARLKSPTGCMSVGTRPVDDTLNSSGIFILD